MSAHLTILIVALVAATLIACGDSDDGDDDVSDGSLLTGIPASDIDGRMEPAPPDASPAITAAEAREAALNGNSSGKILETILVEYSGYGPDGFAKILAWVVNFDPETMSGRPMLMCGDPCPETELMYAYTVIDAMTGEFVVGAESSKPVE